MKKRNNSFVVFILVSALAWLFANQAIYSHAHMIRGGEIVTHAHPYSHEKNSQSPFQSHKHESSVAFFLELITSLNSDSFESLILFLVFLALLATVPVVQAVLPYQPCAYFEVGRAPPRVPRSFVFYTN